jgi:hypothetical protein
VTAAPVRLERYRSLVGTSPWLPVSHDLIDRFARYTGEE